MSPRTLATAALLLAAAAPAAVAAPESPRQAGSASTNGMLFAIAVVLVLAWKVAGWYGADRYLLRYVGVPWTSREVQATTKPPTRPQPTPTA